VTTCAFNVAKVLFDVEAISNRSAVIDLTCKRTRCITLVVCLIDQGY
jgi:hypothetical protein